MEFKVRGNKLYAAGEYEEAITEYSKGIQSSFDSSTADPKIDSGILGLLFVNRGLCYSLISQGSYNALNDYNISIEINPEYAKAYLRRAKTLVAMEQFDAAREDLEKVEKLPGILPDDIVNLQEDLLEEEIKIRERAADLENESSCSDEDSAIEGDLSSKKGEDLFRLIREGDPKKLSEWLYSVIPIDRSVPPEKRLRAKASVVRSIVNAKDEFGRSALHYINSLEILEELELSLISYSEYSSSEVARVQSRIPYIGKGFCRICETDLSDKICALGIPDQLAASGKTYSEVEQYEENGKYFVCCADCARGDDFDDESSRSTDDPSGESTSASTRHVPSDKQSYDDNDCIAGFPAPWGQADFLGMFSDAPEDEQPIMIPALDLNIVDKNGDTPLDRVMKGLNDDTGAISTTTGGRSPRETSIGLKRNNEGAKEKLVTRLRRCGAQRHIEFKSMPSLRRSQMHHLLSSTYAQWKNHIIELEKMHENASNRKKLLKEVLDRRDRRYGHTVIDYILKADAKSVGNPNKPFLGVTLADIYKLAGARFGKSLSPEKATLHELFRDPESTEADFQRWSQVNLPKPKYSYRSWEEDKWEDPVVVGAAINAKDSKGRTPLHYACDVETVKTFRTLVLKKLHWPGYARREVRSNYKFSSPPKCPFCSVRLDKARGAGGGGGYYDSYYEDPYSSDNAYSSIDLGKTCHFGRPDQSREMKNFIDIAHLWKDDRCFISCSSCPCQPMPWGSDEVASKKKAVSREMLCWDVNVLDNEGFTPMDRILRGLNKNSITAGRCPPAIRRSQKALMEFLQSCGGMTANELSYLEKNKHVDANLHMQANGQFAPPFLHCLATSKGTINFDFWYNGQVTQLKLKTEDELVAEIEEDRQYAETLPKTGANTEVVEYDSEDDDDWATDYGEEEEEGIDHDLSNKVKDLLDRGLPPRRLQQELAKLMPADDDDQMDDDYYDDDDDDYYY